MPTESVPLRPFKNKRALLACFAHPDDESFGPGGGVFARYGRENVDTHLVCATKGEVGSHDAEHMQGFSTVAEMREAELRAAARELDLSSVHFLGYRDSGMAGSADNVHPDALAAAPQAQVISQLVQLMRQLRPQVVITFDPIGGYRHPDHLAMHTATLAAFRAAGAADFEPGGLTPFQPDKLYFTVFPKYLLRIGVALMPLFGQNPRAFGRNRDINLLSIASEQFPVHARVDIRRYGEQKAAAAACHKSQQGLPRRGPLGWLLRRSNRTESFMRAYPPALPGLRESDLFAGLA